ncbi:MAG: o-succinylbenzoate synthase [Candidatus Kryptoniota bacterium]
MNIGFEYSSYILKFRKPFVTSKRIFTEKRGLILSLISDAGLIANGDVAPLPDFGTESIEDDINVLKYLKNPIEFDATDPLNSIIKICRDFQDYPALSSGIEQALINLTCGTLGTDLSNLLKRNANQTLLVNGLIDLISTMEAKDRALKLVNEGFETIKLKIGKDDFKEDFSCIKAVREAVGEDIKIRVDLNGKWSFDQAVQNLKIISQFDLEYAEQPVSSIDELIALSKEVSIPIAADESVRDIETARRILETSNVAVLVLKPTIIGGLLPSLEIADLAHRFGKEVVISSAFESSIGRRHIFYVASLVQSSLAHGLSTGSFFTKDIKPESYRLSRGRIEIYDPILKRG